MNIKIKIFETTTYRYDDLQYPKLTAKAVLKMDAWEGDDPFMLGQIYWPIFIGQLLVTQGVY